jgi:hypothetical protein
MLSTARSRCLYRQILFGRQSLTVGEVFNTHGIEIFIPLFVPLFITIADRSRSVRVGAARTVVAGGTSHNFRMVGAKAIVDSNHVRSV